MEIKAYRPLAKVTFFTESGELVARATNDPKHKMDDDVVSISTTRDLQADSPTFTIELVHRKPWHKWIASNDLLVIEMSRPPEVSNRVFIGLVDDCRKGVTASGNSVQRTITVVGRGLAKSLIKFDVGIVPEAEYASTSLGWLLAAGIELAGSTPSEAAQAVWDVLCAPHINYKWNNGKKLFDYTGTKFSDRANLQLLDVSTLMNWQGSIHSLLKDIAEEPFYELFWEMYDGKDTLHVRPTPFNQKEWDALPKSTIKDDEVVADDLGKSDVETFSIYSVGAKTLFSPQDTYKTFGVKPYWNESYAKKYGNYRLHVETSYTPVADSESTVVTPNSMGMGAQDVGATESKHVVTMRSLMMDLYNWNILNNAMLNGTIVVKGSSRFKVGTRLVYDSVEDGSKNEFYITSVSHSFTNFGTYTTSLGVTRGMARKNRFMAPWGSHTEYMGLGIIPYDPVGAREALRNEGSTGFGGSTGGGTGEVQLAQFPMDRIRITQGENGSYSHMGTKSIDFVGTHSKYPYYAPCDCECIRASNDLAVWKSDSEVMCADGKIRKIFWSCIHEVPLSHGVGKKLKKGDLMGHTGVGGTATGDHLHFQVMNGWDYQGFTTNSRGASTMVGTELSIYDVFAVNNVSIVYGYGYPWRKSDYVDGSSGGDSDTGIKGIEYEATGYGATALNLMGGPGWIPTFKTATGTRPVEGRTIAVDRTKIPLHSLVRITCPTYPSVNGDYIAEDVGGAIKGNKIDIYFDDIPPKNNVATRKRLLAFGRRKVFVTVLRKGKG